MATAKEKPTKSSRYFNPAQRRVMRLKLQKRSALKFVSRIILHKQGIIPRSLLRNMFPKLALGFIAVIRETPNLMKRRYYNLWKSNPGWRITLAGH